VAADGANQIAVASGANARVDPRGAAAAVAGLDPSRAAVLLSFELPDPPLVAAAEAAAAAGVPVVANPAPARELPGPLVACGPVLTPNEPEAVALTGLADPREAARALAGRTGAAVVLTLGAAGALVAEPAADPRLVPAPAVRVVDTTGAGDVFSGVLAARLAGRRGSAGGGGGRAGRLPVGHDARRALKPIAARGTRWSATTRSMSPYSAACSAVKKRSRSMSSRMRSSGLPVCRA
jgi:ribokinase